MDDLIATPNTMLWNRSVQVRYEADIAVVGGGIAGVCAACAAAESGAKILLVERFGITGGNATTGGVASFCGETAGQGQIFDRILSDLEQWQAIAPYVPNTPHKAARVFDHHVLAFVLQELLLKHGVKLLLHTRFVDAVVRHGRVEGAILCGKSGPEAVRAKIFIDCTGEAELVHAANLETVKGREADHVQLPMSMMGFVREVDAPGRMPDGWFTPIRNREDLPMVSIWPNGERGKALKIKIPGFDATDTQEITAAEIAARRRMMQVLDYYQQVEGKPWRFDGCAAQIGIREGRRTVGEYVLTVDDLRAGRTFSDAIARGTFYLDAHKPDDDKRTYVLDQQAMMVPPYQIPFRSLVPRHAVNVLVAGRCFSADQLALSSARVTTTCAMLGQAAGIAAALSLRNGSDIKTLDYAEIRKSVEARGGILNL
ncbi:MAG: FAD-dependent oxidoreductase [Phycisphaerae bacterium]